MTEHGRKVEEGVGTPAQVDPRGEHRNGEPAKKAETLDGKPVVPGVRQSDIEPYTGLTYLSRLFRFMAVVIALLLIAEVVTGLSEHGSAAIPTLLGEASRLLVLAGLLWGAGDLALLLIDMGHDVRAARILLGRQAAHAAGGRSEQKKGEVHHHPSDVTLLAHDRPVGRPIAGTDLPPNPRDEIGG